MIYCGVAILRQTHKNCYQIQGYPPKVPRAQLYYIARQVKCLKLVDQLHDISPYHL